MQFRLLGPLEVVRDDGPLSIGRGKRRTLLALLLLDANKVVSHDRLIDAIWGERPPPTARSALHVLVSELRRALGDDGSQLLVTQPSGYVLQLGPDQLDLASFERLAGEGRRALAARDPDRAETKLREALQLWRGPPLQDFAYESFAQAEIARLEELRLEAEENLVEAELEGGRGDQLVARLEALIAEHPHRERLRGQLMLALYRAQRQAEALDAYRDAHRTLVEELGIEPSPALQRLQQAILQHDPTLEPQLAPRTLALPSPRRPGRLLLALVPPALAGIAVGLFFAFRGDKPAEPVPLVAAPPRSVAFFDPATNRLAGAIPLATRTLATTPDPRGIAVGYGSVWVTDGGQQTVDRIDPREHKIVETIGIGADVRTLASGFGSIWVAGGDSATVTRIDARTNRVTATISLGTERGVPNTAFAVATGAGNVWVTAGGDAVARIDPRTNRVVDRIRTPSVYSVGAGERFAWVGTRDGFVLRLEPHGSDTTVKTFTTLPKGDFAGAIKARGSALWVIVAAGTTELWEYDARTGSIVAVIDAGRTNADLAVTGDAIWVANEGDGLVRVDARSGKIVGRVTVRRPVAHVAAGEGAVWAVVAS